MSKLAHSNQETMEQIERTNRAAEERGERFEPPDLIPKNQHWAIRMLRKIFRRRPTKPRLHPGFQYEGQETEGFDALNFDEHEQP